MKRIQITALVLVLLLSLAACAAPAKTGGAGTAAPASESGGGTQQLPTAPGVETKEPQTPPSPSEGAADPDGIAWEPLSGGRTAADYEDVRSVLAANLSGRRAEFRSQSLSGMQEGDPQDAPPENALQTLPDGVAAGSFVQADGSWLYLIDSFGLRIQTLAGADSRIVSYTPVDAAEGDGVWLQELYVSGDRAAVVYTMSAAATGPNAYDGSTHAAIYDVSNREAPVLLADLGADGSYGRTWMVGGVLCLITMPYLWSVDETGDPASVIPGTWQNGTRTLLPADRILISPNTCEPGFTVLCTISLADAAIVDAAARTDLAQPCCAESGAVYLARDVWSCGATEPKTEGAYAVSEWRDRTQLELFRFRLDSSGAITPDDSCLLDGGMLSPTAITIREDQIRAVTVDRRTGFRQYVDAEHGFTNAEAAEPTVSNRLTVLDKSFRTLGALDHLGADKPMISYLDGGVSGWFTLAEDCRTSYTLDLSDPAAPKTGAALSIPGDQRIVQPVSESRLLLLSTVYGDGSLEMRLFDRSDPSQIRELTSGQTNREGVHYMVTWAPGTLYLDETGGAFGFPFYTGDGAGFCLYRYDESGFAQVGETQLEYLPDDTVTILHDGLLYLCSRTICYVLDPAAVTQLAVVTDAVG